MSLGSLAGELGFEIFGLGVGDWDLGIFGLGFLGWDLGLGELGWRGRGKAWAVPRGRRPGRAQHQPFK